MISGFVYSSGEKLGTHYWRETRQYSSTRGESVACQRTQIPRSQGYQDRSFPTVVG
jgi:hypothetical protein